MASYEPVKVNKLQSKKSAVSGPHDQLDIVTVRLMCRPGGRCYTHGPPPPAPWEHVRHCPGASCPACRVCY